MFFALSAYELIWLDGLGCGLNTFSFAPVSGLLPMLEFVGFSASFCFELLPCFYCKL